MEYNAGSASIGEVRRGFQPVGAMGVDENAERDLQGLREPSVTCHAVRSYYSVGMCTRLASNRDMRHYLKVQR